MTIDGAYLEQWSREQQAEAQRRQAWAEDRCAGCGHDWHGLPCPRQMRTGANWGRCLCPTSANLEGPK